MPTKYLVILLSLCATSALSQTDTSPTPAPPPPAFETPGRVEAKLFLPEDLLQGRLYTIGEQAENDGFLNTYFVYSGDHAFAVTTGIALRTRIRELYAIDKLRGMSRTDEFTKAMARAGKEKLDSVVGLVRDPIGTIKRVPSGASRFFGRIGESVKGGGSENEGSALENLTGVEKAKVALAAKLGVSPYSTNQELQEDLGNTARAMAGGGFVVGAATAVVGGPAVTVLNVNENLQQTLVTSTASDLRMLNRKKLIALGVTREHADRFLMHPWYSPWQETVLTDALTTIGANPTAFLERAVEALTEQDAEYFQRLAQVLAHYHKKTALRSIQVENGIVSALDANGILVIPLSCDYAIWSANAAARINDLAQFAQSHSDIKGLALWVDGKVSDRATQELLGHKFALATDVLESEKK